VLVLGEAGFGKSQLLTEMQHALLQAALQDNQCAWGGRLAAGAWQGAGPSHLVMAWLGLLIAQAETVWQAAWEEMHPEREALDLPQWPNSRHGLALMAECAPPAWAQTTTQHAELRERMAKAIRRDVPVSKKLTFSIKAPLNRLLDIWLRPDVWLAAALLQAADASQAPGFAVARWHLPSILEPLFRATSHHVPLPAHPKDDAAHWMLALLDWMLAIYHTFEIQPTRLPLFFCLIDDWDTLALLPETARQAWLDFFNRLFQQWHTSKNGIQGIPQHRPLLCALACRTERMSRLLGYRPTATALSLSQVVSQTWLLGDIPPVQREGWLAQTLPTADVSLQTQLAQWSQGHPSWLHWIQHGMGDLSITPSQWQQWGWQHLDDALGDAWHRMGWLHAQAMPDDVADFHAVLSALLAEPFCRQPFTVPDALAQVAAKQPHMPQRPVLQTLHVLFRARFIENVDGALHSTQPPIPCYTFAGAPVLAFLQSQSQRRLPGSLGQIDVILPKLPALIRAGEWQPSQTQALLEMSHQRQALRDWLWQVCLAFFLDAEHALVRCHGLGHLAVLPAASHTEAPPQQDDAAPLPVPEAMGQAPTNFEAVLLLALQDASPLVREPALRMLPTRWRQLAQPEQFVTLLCDRLAGPVIAAPYFEMDGALRALAVSALAAWWRAGQEAATAEAPSTATEALWRTFQQLRADPHAMVRRQVFTLLLSTADIGPAWLDWSLQALQDQASDVRACACAMLQQRVEDPQVPWASLADALETLGSQPGELGQAAWRLLLASPLAAQYQDAFWQRQLQEALHNPSLGHTHHWMRLLRELPDDTTLPSALEDTLVSLLSATQPQPAERVWALAQACRRLKGSVRVQTAFKAYAQRLPSMSLAQELQHLLEKSLAPVLQPPVFMNEETAS
jgi:hypothetical protein